MDEMLSYFPARDVEEPATKEFVRAESTLVRLETSTTRTELKDEMAELRTELKDEIHAGSTRIMFTMITAMIALNGVTVGLVAALT